MARGTENSGDEKSSGVEAPVSPRVRRAFGLLELFAPALGSRWAIELCTFESPSWSLPAKLWPTLAGARSERILKSWNFRVTYRRFTSGATALCG